MKMSLPRVFAGLSILCLLGSQAARAATTTVTSLSALQTAINSANPGDVIILSNGSYSAGSTINVGVAGTATAPITIEAATIGGATITGSHGFSFASTAAYATVQGFVFKHSAGTITIAAGASHCRFSRNVFQCPGNAAELNIMGDDSQIDFNEFAARNALGQAIEVEGPSGRIAQHVWIHHNYFHDLTNSAGGNGAETIRFGLSGISLTNGFGLIEYNLLLRCNAEPESISNKSCNNTYRYNTLNSNTAEFTIRHGNFCSVYGNYFVNTPGCRFFGDNHKIFSNFFTGCNPAIYIGNGDADVESGGALGSHDRPDNCEISYNTLVNNTVNMNMPSSSGGLGATNTTIANNIIQGGGAAVSIGGPFPNPTYSGNILFNATAGVLPASSYRTVNPLLVADGNGVFHLQSGSPAINTGTTPVPSPGVDMDGQSRDATPDVGADEFSSAPIVAKLLTAADVGPNASVTPQAAAPTFSPVAGTYTSAQSVTITSATSGASIRYTTDGSAPSETNGTLYTGTPVGISSTTTLQAIAFETGFTDSPVTSGTYTITMPKAATPTFSPVSGTYNNDQSVTITSATTGASINYTTDGSLPTETNGILYGGPVSVNATMTLQAIAFASGFADSTVSVAPYTLSVAPLVFSPGAGNYPTAQNVTISTATIGAIIRYSTDGSTPSNVYTGPIPITGTTTVQATASKAGYSNTVVGSATYTIGSIAEQTRLEAESLSPVGSGATVSTSADANASSGVVEFLNSTAAGQTITFTTPAIAAGTYQFQLRYKTNTSRGQHTVKIDGVQVGGTLDQYATTQAYVTATLGNVILSGSGTHTIVMTVTGKNSAATQFYLTADLFVFTPQNVQQQVSAPVFSPPSGAPPLTVTITSATSGASIRYTTDGSTPSETTGTVYSGPINVTSTVTFKAIAYEAGFTDSGITTASYAGNPPPTLNFEAENLSPVGTGATVSTSTDANASGGVVEFLNSTAVGQVMSFTTPSIPAGTYVFQLRYWANTTRGQFIVKIDGVQIGGTIDQYASAKGYVTVTLGTVTFPTAGPHTITLTVTGKNSAATQFYLTADKFTFVGQ